MLVGAGYTNCDLVFAAPDGAPWNPDSIGRAFARAVARTDLPRTRLHDLRHGPRHAFARSQVNGQNRSAAIGVTEGIRTPDLRDHNPALSPTELRPPRARRRGHPLSAPTDATGP
jgi:hypothetical protein